MTMSAQGVVDSKSQGCSLELGRSLAVHVGCRIDMLVTVKDTYKRVMLFSTLVGRGIML